MAVTEVMGAATQTLLHLYRPPCYPSHLWAFAPARSGRLRARASDSDGGSIQACKRRERAHLLQEARLLSELGSHSHSFIRARCSTSGCWQDALSVHRIARRYNPVLMVCIYRAGVKLVPVPFYTPNILVAFSAASPLLGFITTLKIKPACGEYVWQSRRGRDVTKNSSSPMSDAFSAPR